MFLSIKWKALIFLSLILLIMSAGWLFTSVNKNIQDLQNRLEEKNHQQQLILNQMIEDDFLKISQFAQLIAKSSEIQNYRGAVDNNVVQQFLDSSWFEWNLNLSLDYLAVLTGKESLIADISQFALANNIEQIRNALRPFQKDALSEPISLVFCQDSCIQLIMEPFLFQSGEQGVIVLGQNMSELVYRYAHLSGTDLAILLNSMDEIDADKEDITSSIWAMSHYKELLPVLGSSYKVSHPNEPLSFWDILGKNYFYKELKVDSYFQVGNSPTYLTIFQEKERIELFKQELWNAVMTSVLIFLLSETILFILLLGPLQRVLRIVKAQSYLPEGSYDKAIDMVDSNHGFFRDELTSLENSTLKMAEELKLVDDETSLLNNELAKKVSMLTRSKDFLQRLFDNANLLIAILDCEQQKIVNRNLLFNDFFEDGDDLDFSDLFVKSHEKLSFYERIQQLLNQQIDDFQHETTMLEKNNRFITVVWTHTLVEGEDGEQRILSLGVDITQRKQDEETLFWIANHDSLTKISNRHAFHEKLNDLLIDKKSGALIFIDVNKFKQINDLHGHSVGDLVLIDVANKLKDSVRDNDFVSRLSGDEFTVILTRVKSDSLPNIMHNLWHRLIGMVETENGKLIEYDVSMGATVFPDQGTIEQDLIVQTDMAMYQAKKLDNEKWHIFDSDDDTLNKMKQEQKQLLVLKSALKDDSFELAFQPTLSISDGMVNHYEALLRLNYEDGTPYPPGDFIPLAEKSGLIRQIDYWVIRNVYTLLQKWHEDQPELSIGINVSAPTLQDRNFHTEIIELNYFYKIPFDSITIELTETAYIEDFANVHANLKYLHQKGFKISLDDFGVGYSSFSYLRELPLDYVKLDGSYVNGVARNSENQAFIQSVVIMAEEFNMKIIAEFVEDPEDLKAIKLLGVDLVQGYLIGKPRSELLNSDEIENLSSLIAE